MPSTGQETLQDVFKTRAELNGLDAFELRLGDVLRGERAALGMSLVDVERQLKIKKEYIQGIESADLSVFNAPGFIAGYVRSYARYLGIDPDWVYERFLAEAGVGPIKVVRTSNDAEIPRARNKGGFSWIRSLLAIRQNRQLGIIDFSVIREVSSKNPGKESFDLWVIASLAAGTVGALLAYISDPAFFGEEPILRIAWSAVVGTSVAAILNWFHPKNFFARAVYLFFSPIAVSSLFGLRVSIDLNGQYFGGFFENGGQSDPVLMVVCGLLAFVAMLLHKKQG